MQDAEARLAALGEAGARVYDPAGWGLVGALLGRAERTVGGARDVLRARAEARLVQLSDAFAAAHARATEALATIPEDSPRREQLTRALESGDLLSVVQAARCQARRSPFGAHARGAFGSRAVWRTAAASYARSCEDMQAAVSVAHAIDAVPEASGPYNALSLAARTLGELGSLSPAYLRAHVMRLEDLGALLQLPPVMATPPPRSRAKRSNK